MYDCSFTQKNRDLLLGRSMSHADTNVILQHLRRDPVVAFVTDTKTEEIGPGIFRFKAEVAWNGDKVCAFRYLYLGSRCRCTKIGKWNWYRCTKVGKWNWCRCTKAGKWNWCRCT